MNRFRLKTKAEQALYFIRSMPFYLVQISASVIDLTVSNFLMQIFYGDNISALKSAVDPRNSRRKQTFAEFFKRPEAPASTSIHVFFS